MKKLICVLLVVCMIPAFSFAADLTGMSFDDLVKLRDEVNTEIVTRPEWKETEVPAGQWTVGEDIPAGTYSLTSVDRQVLIQVWKKAVNDYSNNGLLFNEIVKKEKPYGKIKLEDGWVFENNRPVIFSKPEGLSF